MSEILIVRVMAAFAGCETAGGYAAAKRLAARLDPIAQMAMVDEARAARGRLIASGVVL